MPGNACDFPAGKNPNVLYRHLAKAVMAGIDQIHRVERSALELGIFVPGTGKKKSRHINLGPAAIHILGSGLAEIHLHLLSQGKLRHCPIASAIGMPGQMIFLP